MGVLRYHSFLYTTQKTGIDKQFNIFNIMYFLILEGTNIPCDIFFKSFLQIHRLWASMFAINVSVAMCQFANFVHLEKRLIAIFRRFFNFMIPNIKHFPNFSQVWFFFLIFFFFSFFPIAFVGGGVALLTKVTV